MWKTKSDGRPVEIISEDVQGVSIFKIFGLLDGVPRHWTKDGHFRGDGKEDPLDIVEEMDWE